MHDVLLVSMLICRVGSGEIPGARSPRSPQPGSPATRVKPHKPGAPKAWAAFGEYPLVDTWG